MDLHCFRCIVLNKQEALNLQIISTYQADPSFGRGEAKSQGGALASMFISLQWVVAKEGDRSETFDESRPEEESLYCLVDIDIATGKMRRRLSDAVPLHTYPP